MNLLVAEWKRFFARRFTRIMLVIVLVLLGIILIGTGRHSQTLGPADYASARSQQQEFLAQDKAQVAACEAANANGPAPAGSQYDTGGATCSEVYGSFTPSLQNFLPGSWNFATEAKDMILLFGGILALFGFAVGASFVGAEWSSGNMANMLLWRPRRLALLGTKFAALLLGVFVSAVVLGAIWLGLLLGLAKFRGSMGHITPGLERSLALDGARGLGLALIVTALGFAIAAIGRGTVTALGIAVGYAVIVEGAGIFILNSLHVLRPERFILSRYVAAWLDKSYALEGPTICGPMTSQGQECQPGPDWYMRMHSSAEVFAIGTAILLAWAFVAFRRRDVS